MAVPRGFRVAATAYLVRAKSEACAQQGATTSRACAARSFSTWDVHAFSWSVMVAILLVSLAQLAQAELLRILDRTAEDLDGVADGIDHVRRKGARLGVEV